MCRWSERETKQSKTDIEREKTLDPPLPILLSVICQQNLEGISSNVAQTSTSAEERIDLILEVKGHGDLTKHIFDHNSGMHPLIMIKISHKHPLE